MTDKLTHLNESHESHMVDVSGKPETVREAVATATIVMQPSTRDAIIAGNTPKGEVLSVARVAGIQAAKRTSDAIPMCHPLMLNAVEIRFDTDAEMVGNRAPIVIETRVRCTGKTGVEMEALHAASVAALTIYDMAKALEKGMEIVGVRLVSKRGGKSGDWKSESTT